MRSLSKDQSNQVKIFRNMSVRQLPDNRSGISIVWLDNALRSLSEETRNRLHSFKYSCFVNYYSSILKCIKYLKQARTRPREYVITIIVGYPLETTQRIIHRLQLYRIVQTIFVIRSDKDFDHRLSLVMNNIQVFQCQQSMFEVLEKRIEEVAEQDLNGDLFKTFCRPERSLKDMVDDQATFVWTHVFKFLLKNMPHDALQAKRQMLNECRAYYRNDPIELAQIEEFEHKYQSNQAIKWYTKPGFLYKLVNKALRSQDIWALYKFRYFIMDLNNQLEELSQFQSLSKLRLYRGAKLNRTELEQVKINSLISTNSFLSCSINRNVAEMFIDIQQKSENSLNSNENLCQQSVLFIIDVDNTKSEHTVVADISQYSEIPDEEERLFNFGSTFIIKNKSFDKKKGIWLIEMEPSSDHARINQDYEKYIRRRLEHIHPMMLLGHISANIGGDLNQWMSYFHRLLKILPHDHYERPNVYYVLGNIYRFIEKFDKSLECFRSARLLIRRFLPERMFDYCRILDGMGINYSILGDSERAILLFEQVSTLQKKSFPDDHSEIPFHLNVMGEALYRAKQYHRALEILQTSKEFFLKKMSIELQGYAQTLHIMGLVYRALGDHNQALILFKEAADRRYSLLGKEHPHLATTYYQISLLHCDRAQYELALTYIEKAVNIQLIKLPHSHTATKQSLELLRRIHQSQFTENQAS